VHGGVNRAVPAPVSVDAGTGVPFLFTLALADGQYFLAYLFFGIFMLWHIYDLFWHNFTITIYSPAGRDGACGTGQSPGEPCRRAGKKNPEYVSK
jgi:hypothetical protein